MLLWPHAISNYSQAFHIPIPVSPIAQIFASWVPSPQADRDAGGAAVAHALLSFGKPAAWHWEHFGQLWEKWLLPSSPLLSLTAHPALGQPALSLSLCPQMGRQDTVLIVWHIPALCRASWSMALDSAASPSSAAVLPSPFQHINHIFMQHGLI